MAVYFNTQDHGIFRDADRETNDPQYEQYRRTLSQDLNRQGAVVLEGRTVGKYFKLLKKYIYEFCTALFHFSCIP